MNLLLQLLLLFRQRGAVAPRVYAKSPTSVSSGSASTSVRYASSHTSVAGSSTSTSVRNP
jgi:hypothetical protein